MTAGLGYRFCDRRHGRTAPPFLRKHCSYCGKTIPNRTRAPVCFDCHLYYHRSKMMQYERMRRGRIAQAEGRFIRPYNRRQYRSTFESRLRIRTSSGRSATSEPKRLAAGGTSRPSTRRRFPERVEWSESNTSA